MTLDELPESTSDVMIGKLSGDIDVGHISAWAQDLMVLGIDDDETIRLAVLDPLDWPEARDLLPKVAAKVGLQLDERETMYRWVERHILRKYVEGAISEAELLQRGYHVWVRLLGIEGSPNPFDIYNELDDELMIDSGGRGIDKMPASEARVWLIDRLTADGAFERTGLPRP